MARKTTLRDVAAAAKVSLSTVDRVLNGRGGVDPTKEFAVIEAARKLRIDRNLAIRPTRLLKIGVVISEPSNPFYASLHRAFRRANQICQASNMQCAMHHIDVRAPKQAAAVIAAAASTHDALVIVSPAEVLIAKAIAGAAAAIPVVTLVSDVPGSGRLAYVGIDNRTAGRVAGELMGKFLGPSGGDVVVVSGLHSFIGHEEREMGFRAVLQERFHACHMVAVVETQEQGANAGALVERLFALNPGISGIYNVSVGNREIAKALERLNPPRHVILITHELSPERKRLLHDGVIDAIIDQDPELEVITAVEMLAHHFGRRDPPSTSGITPLRIYLRENS